MKRIAALTCLFVVVSVSLHAQRVTTVESRTREFMFEAGLGAGAVSYPSPLERDVAYLESLPAVDRVTLSLHATAGWAISDAVYATLGVYAIGDRLFDTYGESLQLNNYLYGLGARWYPFTTGLVLGGEVGASRIVIQSSSLGNNVSPWGYGWRAVAAYDFARDPVGFSVTTGLSVSGLVVDGGGVGVASLYLSVIWK